MELRPRLLDDSPQEVMYVLAVIDNGIKHNLVISTDREMMEGYKTILERNGQST